MINMNKHWQHARHRHKGRYKMEGMLVVNEGVLYKTGSSDIPA